MADAGNEAVFCSAWLSSQCTRISGIIAGLLMMPPPAKGLTVTSTSWPRRNPYIEDLLRLAERASSERRTVVLPARMEPDTSLQPVGLLVALPLGSASQPVAVVAVALAAGSSATLAPENIAEQLRWGAGWLEALPWAQRSKDVSTDIARAASSLDFLAAIGEQPRLQGMAIAVANDLAARLRCDRVSVGIIRRNGSIRLRAISHSASFKGQGRLVDATENAMEEALDQRTSVAHPPLPSTERAVTMAHRALTEIIRVQGTSLISVVMADGKGELVGAITFERHRNELFDKEALQLAEAIAALLGPIVGLQLRANRLLAGRAIDRVDDGIISLFGPRHPGLKLAAIGVIALALFLALAKGEHRVTAKSVLEGEVQRAAVAPFDGFIRSAPVRAGDTVKAGDVLAALEDRDLILERAKWRAERDKLVQKQREVRAKHDRTNLVILDSQIRQAEAQLALAEEKLSRARILAPFDAIVVSGDLSQTLGSPVERGKTLFELAPLDSYRLIIHVDERDVRYVAMGQSGTVAFAGVPWTPLRMALSKITP
ncbi:MAG TPA: HlyD family efflux transporter periplasmic adaptor subunit, partial [Gemmatimonadaceae bacterium]|nr:HlyD family efflux transporter periplasmic adaptor subunit [Gemmatimonadaceae bacterium]